MKNLLLGNMALLALAMSSATGADLRSRPMLAKAPGMAPVFNWSGFYLGVNGGFGWGHSMTEITIVRRDPPASQDLNQWLGGGQVGYNWQMQTLVLGVEADIQAAGQKGTLSFNTPAVCPMNAALPCTAGSGNIEQKLPWFGTVRGRLGVTPTATWLLYVTGGLAYGEVDANAAFTELLIPSRHMQHATTSIS
jgi:outer membrane immunogenic protein